MRSYARHLTKHRQRFLKTPPLKYKKTQSNLITLFETHAHEQSAALGTGATRATR